MRRMLRGVGAVLWLWAVAAAGHASAAESWPERPVRLIVPLGAGSGADVTARLLADRLTERWHQPVIVENRPGADGIVGINAFLMNPNDHVLLFTATGTFTTHPLFYETVPYDQKDLMPVARVTNTVLSISVPSSLGVDTLQQLFALVAAQPNKRNWSSVTGATEMVFAGFLKESGLSMVRVSYRQPTQATSDLSAGRIDVMMSAVVTVRPQVTAGSVKLLALTNHERAPAAPGVPTAAESGYPGLEFDGLSGLFATRATPPELRERIAADVSAALADPTIAQKIEATGQIVSYGPPAEFTASIEAQRTKFTAIGKLLGLPAKAAQP